MRQSQPTPSTFDELASAARDVRGRFAAAGRRDWSVEVWLAELTKQVGDLAARILTTERFYLPDRDSALRYGGGRDAIADELADILYCVLAIADAYGVDLPKAHARARRRELEHLTGLCGAD